MDKSHLTPDDSLPGKLFNSILEATKEDASSINFGAQELLNIAFHEALHDKLIQKIKDNDSGSRFKEKMADFVDYSAEKFEDEANGSEAYMELVDRTVLPVSIGVVVGGVALYITQPALAIGATIVYICGLSGIVVGGGLEELISSSERTNPNWQSKN